MVFVRSTTQPGRQGRFGPRGRNTSPRGFTLIELLVVISIIALMLSILLPALTSAKETAAVTQCLANLGELAKTSGMYNSDNDAGGTTIPTQPWHLGSPYCGITVQYVSEWVYGGFQTSIVSPDFGANTDWHMYPTEIRPYNKYIAPGRTGPGVIKSYVCPSDRCHVSSAAGEHDPTTGIDDRYGAWEVSGNSYPINWYWYYDPMFASSFDLNDLAKMSACGSKMLVQKVGGNAAEFPLFWEDILDAFMYEAKPPDGSEGPSLLVRLGVGWHRKLSMYSAGFYDGHSEYKFFDTRFTRGPGYNIRP
jgi:prepilin-type N-terminal cleavage/methylation domain-containing protein